MYKCQNICIKNQDIYLFQNYISVSNLISFHIYIYIYIYKRIKEDIIFQSTRMFELLVLLFIIQLLARSNIFIPNIDKGDSQFQLNTIEKTTELLHVPFLKNLKKNYKKEKKIKKPFGNR